jgi:pimeloyl-ACP methyl ester carboxylesterase
VGSAASRSRRRSDLAPTLRPILTLELSDGRTLAYELWGDPTGTPVIFQHGTGDSRLARHPDESATSDLGIRLVTVDRPGVGGSTHKPNRSLLEWVPDVSALADALDLERFAVAGWSGGGPHALAIASALPERVTKVALAACLAPFDTPGARDLVENKDLRMIWKLSHLKFIARAAGRLESKHDRKHLSDFVDSIGKDAPSDRSVLGDPELHPMFEEEMGEALRQGGIGVLDDMWAFLDWGFTPEQVTQHVELFYGEQDEILSPEMSRTLAARLPDAIAHSWAGGGHYSVFAHWREFLGAIA